ncbi:hypothetical protein EVAR_52459_1 [Eumeta japonica]|uniref:Uncharacterized protein n=1 Tax=Eumeta variegata TaxID=151549 RepID=A0A4C1Z1Z9_EUMVA|nr:hypothetical protein EVAR_52459_1 [Eumeta japonica]
MCIISPVRWYRMRHENFHTNGVLVGLRVTSGDSGGRGCGCANGRAETPPSDVGRPRRRIEVVVKAIAISALTFGSTLTLFMFESVTFLRKSSMTSRRTGKCTPLAGRKRLNVISFKNIRFELLFRFEIETLVFVCFGRDSTSYEHHEASMRSCACVLIPR